MKFQDKLKSFDKEQIWNEYCGFLDLGIDEYMYIQNRLMEEQLSAWKSSGLGHKLLRGADPRNIDEFREVMPLTDYYDYAETLLARKSDMLPGEPIIWIQTTWEGGLRPIKVAPYTQEMLESYKHNALAVTMLASSRAAGNFNIKNGDRMLYGGAPLPYATGILPLLLNENVDFTWLPDDNASSGLSFGQRIKVGFSMAMRGGIDFFFAIGSVANYITENFGNNTESRGHSGLVSPVIALRYLKAKYMCRRDGRKIMPKDIFHIKGLVCTGTDANCYKAALAKAWGVVPIEMAAGTENACIGTETWERNGMVLFPDTCFYEFISESEMLHNIQDNSYKPRTCLMDEVRTGESYELVISVLHGGAFMRYRIGDMYRCVSTESGGLPRFTFIDRVPTIIDIAGFTRITEASIEEVISISKLGIGEWLAKKEFDGNGVPFLHMYIEFPPETQGSDVTKKMIITEHLSVYFKYLDSDYNDLKKLLGMEPLIITILKYGTIASYRECTGRIIPRINPEMLDINEILRSQQYRSVARGGTAK
ncbi:MAG: auxin-responsive protein [Clostridia bacterium]|nr:auxin-responsive protein [Clostridia bacterium]